MSRRNRFSLNRGEWPTSYKYRNVYLYNIMSLYKYIAYNAIRIFKITVPIELHKSLEISDHPAIYARFWRILK